MQKNKYCHFGIGGCPNYKQGVDMMVYGSGDIVMCLSKMSVEYIVIPKFLT